MKVFVALGSNVGDRAKQMMAALAEMEAVGAHVVRVSNVYETEPIGLREQHWFLNAVAQVETVLFPRQLLVRLRKIEAKLGRRRTIVNGPRTIDLDIIFYGRAVIRTPELEVPHPRYSERRFVLEPLAELDATLRDPMTRQTVASMLEAVRGQAVRRLAGEPLKISQR